MIREMCAGTVAARLAALVQHRHAAHHGKVVVNALGNQETNVGSRNPVEQHLSCAAPRQRYDRRAAVVPAHRRLFSANRDVASGKHCEYKQAWSACNKGYFRAYLPPAAIAMYSMRALDGIEEYSEVFAIAAGSGRCFSGMTGACAATASHTHCSCPPQCLWRQMWAASDPSSASRFVCVLLVSGWVENVSGLDWSTCAGACVQQ